MYCGPQIDAIYAYIYIKQYIITYSMEQSPS
jgi:hypothetical protein